MGLRQTILAAGLLPLALWPLTTHAGIFRCTAPGGAVSYQEAPCPDPNTGRTLDMPAEYPAIDSQQREWLFQREAALDQRLEARRERESRETIAAINRPPPAAREPAAPAYFAVWPGISRWQRTRAASGIPHNRPRW